MAESKAQRSNRHWSVDFVEHLRTIHFALAALSVTLMILTAPPDRRLSKALTEVSQLYSAQQQWPDIKEQMLKRAAIRAESPLRIEGLRVFIYKRKGKDDAFFDMTIDAHIRQEDEDVQFGGTPMQTPITIDDFARWWNKIYHDGIDIEIADLKLPFRDCSVDEPPRYYNIKCDPDNAHRVFNPHDDAVAAVRYNLDETDFFHVGRVLVVTEKLTRVEGGALIEPPLRVKFYVPAFRFHFDQSILHSCFLINWNDTALPFAVAFPNIRFIPPELRYISIKDALPRIADLQPKSEDYAEILGLKIPIQDVVEWGSGLLFACQLYFWLHLRELSGKFERNSPGREVAWIGIYTSGWASGVVVITACLLPIIAFALTLRRANVELSQSVWIATFALILGVLLAMDTLDKLLRLGTSVD